jgi:DNA-binding beta-propeller fold protein YncE
MMNNLRHPHLLRLLLAAVLCLGGCADVKYTMHMDPEFRNATPLKTWPQAPDAPRYRYVGQLLGEENFVSDEADRRNMGMKVLYWLVGLFEDGNDKVTLRRPQTGTVDEKGRVYVTDVSNHAVFVFDQSEGKLLVWERATEKRSFVTPIGIVLGVNGQVLVADAELGEVFRLDQDGKPLGSFGKGLLNRPTGLARDAKRGRIYVSDTHAHDIKVFDDAGQWLETLGGRGEADGELNFPTHMTFSADKLYVTDTMNARIQIFDAQGKALASLGKRGLYYGELSRPKGVTVDANGNIYVVESLYDNLLVFDSQGRFLMPLGGTGREIGQFYLPSGVWSDSKGRVYVADMFNGRVVIFQFIEGT